MSEYSTTAYLEMGGPPAFMLKFSVSPLTITADISQSDTNILQLKHIDAQEALRGKGTRF